MPQCVAILVSAALTSGCGVRASLIDLPCAALQAAACNLYRQASR
ncbi:hypothetical protein [Edwardsiella hoshinae]|nr:hypothetical protein [Edwardsiella hoshinae]